MQVMLGFDMETDVGSWTPYYNGLRPGTEAILGVLKKHSISGTFFFTADCARKHPDVVAAVRNAGHEIGAHTLFHETLGDEIFPIPGMMPILPEEVPNRIRLCTKIIGEISGVAPVSFRCPRLFGSTTVANTLDELGYLTDSTYPMYYFRERLRPYHPSKEDWTKEGDLRLLELPLFADLSMQTQDEYGRDMDQWPLYRTEGAHALLSHIDGFAGYCRTRNIDPFLAFYFHPWEFHPMPQGPIPTSEGSVTPLPFIVKNCGEYAIEQLDLTIENLLERKAEFRQAREMALEAQ